MILRLPDPDQPRIVPRYTHADLDALAYEPVRDPDSFASLLNDGRLPSPLILLLCEGSIRWRDLEPWLAVLTTRGLSADCMLLE